MSNTFFVHEKQQTGTKRGLSGAVFSGCAIGEAMARQNEAIFHIADFLGTESSTSPVQGLTITADSLTISDDDGGTATLATSTSSGNSMTAETGSFGSLDVDAVTSFVTGFEARLQVDDLTSMGLLVGIGAQAETVSANMTNGVVQNTNELYAIHVSSTNATLKAYAKYVDEGTSIQAPTNGLSADVLAVDTYYKFGIRIHQRPDGSGPEINWYLDGVKLYTVNVDVDANINDITDMIGFIHLATAEAAAKTAIVDWVAFYSENETQ